MNITNWILLNNEDINYIILENTDNKFRINIYRDEFDNFISLKKLILERIDRANDHLRFQISSNLADQIMQKIK